MAERILVVDDDESMRKMLEVFLVREGYRVDTAEGVRDAAEILEANDYHIILIDKNMPGIDGNSEGGLELLSHVRSLCRCATVIMMTGNPTVEAVAKASEFGAACFMSKPFSLIELRQKIDTLSPERSGRLLNR